VAGYEAPAHLADLAGADASDGDPGPHQTAVELLLCPLGLMLLTLSWTCAINGQRAGDVAGSGFRMCVPRMTISVLLLCDESRSERPRAGTLGFGTCTRHRRRDLTSAFG